ncbi:MAG: GSCFA domain-containing protein [Muribaculaceae bacterium]|nr:GSCFA domain-containing protein [Muribaculaceae bacterium]
MKFRTEIERTPCRWNINHKDGILMLGSCFTDNIGSMLRNALFDVDINPFGTTFNPASIASSLARIYDNSPFEPYELVEREGRWISMWHHSAMALPSQNETLRLINNRIFNAHQILASAQVLIITWGTAWVFERKSDGMLVNNCHKFPATDFNRQLLDVKEIADTYVMLFDVLWRLNPNLRVILTVSPVRHLSDGLSGNQISKSKLRIAADEICNRCGEDKVVYFPAYEALNDDLRDYRYYASDMVHPSDMAINYIYELFIDIFTNEQTRQIAKECESYSRLAAHRVMNQNEVAIKAYCDKVLSAKTQLCKKYPYLSDRL